jgi:hypothetical protein
MKIIHAPLARHLMVAVTARGTCAQISRSVQGAAARAAGSDSRLSQSGARVIDCRLGDCSCGPEDETGAVAKG